MEKQKNYALCSFVGDTLALHVHPKKIYNRSIYGTPMNASIIYDELGRAITISSKLKAKSTSLKDSITTIKGISSLLETSLGPNGLDKILQSPDDDITITNDGATILKEMIMTENPISKLLQRLSSAQDEEIGDGTTSVVLIASALLTKAVKLIEKGIHPIKVSEGYDVACKMVVEHLESIKEEIKPNWLKENMKNAALTSLNSKIVRKAKDAVAEVCVNAILRVCDRDRRDVDFELIKIVKKIGTDFKGIELVNGVLLDKSFSHSQMKKIVEDGRIALLTCPFEPPKLKTKNELRISSVEDYRSLENYEKEKFVEMIRCIKNSGANVILCQWGFDDEANSLLMEHGLPAIRWVGGQDLELAAVYTGGSIISRFEDLREEDLGKGSLKEVTLGTQGEKMIKLENNDGKTVTILVRASSDLALAEAERCVTDALSAARNILTCPFLVYGGGSSEIACSLKLLDQLNKVDDGEERECLEAFASALEEIPLILARNSGLDSLKTLDSLKAEQVRTKFSFLGVDCMGSGSDMKKNKVFDSLISKKKQMLMATQLVNMVLKIDEIVYVQE